MGAKEMTLQKEAELRDLAERAQRIRRSLPSTAAAGTGSEQTPLPPEPENREAGCGRCNKGFTYLHLSDAIPAPRYCRECSLIVTRQENDAESAVEQRSYQERLAGILEMIDRAGANAAEHGRATLDSFDTEGSPANTIALREARAFVADVLQAGPFDPVRGLYLYGETGTGKTHLAAAVLRELLLSTKMPTRDVVYDHAAELIARIQDTYSTKTSTFDVLDKRSKAKVWLLDDLGTERASSDVAQHLTLIFTKRALRPTVITSNLSPEQFEARNPELVRVGSRLGPAYFRVVEVVGRDRRFG